MRLKRQLRRVAIAICGVGACAGLALGDAPVAGAAQLAQVGRRVVMAVRGPHGALEFYARPDSSYTWTGRSFKGLSIIGEPSVTGFANVSAEIVAETSRGLWTWSQSGLSGGWTVRPVTSDQVYSEPSIARVHDRWVVAVEGKNNSLTVYSRRIGASTWNRQAVAGPNTTYSAPSVAWVGNSVVVAAQGPRNSLKFYWQPYPSSRWSKAESVGQAFSRPSVAQVGNSSVIVAQGWNRSSARVCLKRKIVHFYWQAIGTKDWHEEDVGNREGGAFPCTRIRESTKAPSVAQVGNASVIAVEDSGLKVYSQAIGVTGWNAEPFPPSPPFAPPVVTAPTVAKVVNTAAIVATAEIPTAYDPIVGYYYQYLGTTQWFSQLLNDFK